MCDNDGDGADAIHAGIGDVLWYAGTAVLPLFSENEHGGKIPTEW